MSVTNSKRLTTKLQRRIRKNIKYLILNPESNLGCGTGGRSQTRNAAPRLASPCALARPLRARSLALHRSASSCISRTARSSRTPLASPRTQHVPFQLCRTFTHSDAEFSLCQRVISSTLAHISAIPSGRWINQRTECPRFARTSARRSRQRKMDEREAREEEEEAAIPSSSRRMLPCLRVSLLHSRTAAASSASHALWPWQCYRASVFVRMCNAMSHVCNVCVGFEGGVFQYSPRTYLCIVSYTRAPQKQSARLAGFPAPGYPL